MEASQELHCLRGEGRLVVDAMHCMAVGVAIGLGVAIITTGQEEGLSTLIKVAVGFISIAL